MPSVRQTLAPCLIGLALVAGACSSSSNGESTDPNTATPTTSSTSTAPTTTASPAPSSTISTTTISRPEPTTAELVAAVDAFWDLYLELGARTDTFDPVETRARLEERTTGDELQVLFDFLQSNTLAGYVVRGDIESSLEVVSATADRAEVRDCYDDTTGLYRIDTNERLDTDTPERHQVLYVLVNEDGVWKVSEIKGEADGCVVSS